MDMNSYFLEECQGIMNENGIFADDLVADGSLHGTGTSDKPQDKDVSYIIHVDTPQTLWWQNHRTG